MSGDERRDQILKAAIEVFSHRGFKGTTTKEIAKASGISEAMIFRHFENKDALYKAIIDLKRSSQGKGVHVWETNQDLIKAIEEKNDFRVFYEVAISSMTKHRSDIGFMRLLFYSALEEHELAEKFFLEFIEQVYAFFSGYIETRQRDGAFRDVKPRLVVRAFLGMLINHSLHNILWDKKRRLLNVSDEEAAESFTNILLNGLKVRND